MFCKMIDLTENKLAGIIFFSGQDKSLARQIIAALDKVKDPRQINFAAE